MHAPRLTHPSASTAHLPIGWRRDGRPIMPILGAEDAPAAGGEGEGGAGEGAEGGSGGGEGAGGEGEGEGAGGKKPTLEELQAELAATKRESRKWETQSKKNKDAAAELAKLKGESKNETEKALDAMRAEVTSKANKRIVRSEVKAIATELFADAADAPLYVDLDQFEVDDEGDVDATAITAALKEVLKRKPHLAKPDPKGGGGKGDPGFGGGGAGSGTPEDIAAKIAAAEKAGDHNTATQLKIAQLTSTQT